MAANLLTRHRAAKWMAYAGGALVTVGVGLLLIWKGGAFERASYDVPFLLQHQVPDELVMIYFSANVKRSLGQRADQPLDRRFFARTLERLTRDRARLVLLDVLLDEPGPESLADEALANSIQRHGRVVLVAESVKQLQGNILTDSTVPPLQLFQAAAAGYGLANIEQDSDFGIRKLDIGADQAPSADLVAARLLDATRKPFIENTWLNYYCPPEHLQAVTLDRVLGDDLPAGFFRDKIVVIGDKPEARIAGADREEFGNPYSKFGGSPSSGAAVHAMSLLNLTRGDFLRRLSLGQELLIAAAWGVLICIGLARLSPWLAIAVATLAALLFALLAASVQLRYHTWFAWTVPAAAQTGVALVWAVGYRYTIELRRRKKLRRAFAVYLSPHMVDQIADSDFDLAPGGKEVEATILFTDLEGFTPLSENLSPAALSRILNLYFEDTARSILEQDGTLVKFIGDAVLAAWGAPLPEPKPEERAVRAALAIRAASAGQIEGFRLRTRMGINSGIVLAGFLGSEARMEYTVIGDAINIGQRLEQLNKQLGTEILISQATRNGLSEQFLLRRAGRFLLAGKTTPVEAWEVLGQTEPNAPEIPWLELFSNALELFARAEFVAAADLFEKVIQLRGGKDGPSEFYRREIRRLPEGMNPALWDGIIRLEEK